MTNSDKDITRVSKGVYRKRRPTITEQLADPSPASDHLSADITRILVQMEEQLELLSTTPYSVKLRLTGKAKLPALPTGYHFKGGASRELLRGILHGRHERIRVRDYDLVRFIETSDEEDHRLALKFMPDDYEYGHGVEVVEDEETYFRTRDLTVNEVLYRNGILEASFQSLRDLSKGVLRPTSHVTDADGHVLSATVVKMVRFAAEAESRNLRWSIEDTPELPDVTPFDLALNLDRALASSQEVAQEYLLLAWQRKLLLPARQAPPSITQAVEWLARHIKQGISLFRNLPPEVAKEISGRL